MINRLKIWINSKSWFWKLRTVLRKIEFFSERKVYKWSASVTKAKTSAQILSSFTWIGVKGLFWVVLILSALNLLESYLGNRLSWFPSLSLDDRKFKIEQLRLYAQLLTAIFSIYFATIGIILSSGYTRLRRDIIHMLVNEHVGNMYSKVLVLAAIFCLTATALPLFGVEPGLFIYFAGTILTILSALALFPLGQRLFSFFDLKLLINSEILPNISRHIEGAANPRNSISLAHHHSKAARQALEQLFYIDDRAKADKDGMQSNLTALSDNYTVLLLHYLQKKHTINQKSYWFPRKRKHKQWFFAGDSTTSMALKTRSQQMLVEEKLDYQWLENEIVSRLMGHIELAFQAGHSSLALKLINRFSTRTTTYAEQFQFSIGMQELKKLKNILKQTFSSSETRKDVETIKLKMAIADTWAALGCQLCLETLRRIITFEKELKQFFEIDEWSDKSLRSLPTFLQVELTFIVEYIKFEQDTEGQRLSKPKYVQQLAVQKLLQHYAGILASVCDFYLKMLPDFVDTLIRLKTSEPATQVVLGSLHSYWKLPGWFEEIEQLLGRYQKYMHYSEELYAVPEVNVTEMSRQLAIARDDAIFRLSNPVMIGHIFESKHNDELPDHFGQIYFELAEACIDALEQNDETKLDKVLPMFLSLAFLADSRFMEQSLDVHQEFRLHLISMVVNDMASVLGFSILYGAYFDNDKLSDKALAKFNTFLESAADKKQYLSRMVLISNPHSFSMSASPRDLIRINWKISFEQRAREDGFGDQFNMERGKQHPNKIVNKFLSSLSDASHLFFAKQVLPQIEPVSFEVDYRITSFAQQLREDEEEMSHEDF